MMDKDWVHLNRCTREYMNGASSFVEMANRDAGNLGKILCPCKHCRNLSQHCGIDVYEQLVINGIDPTYTTWFHHGELPSATQKGVIEGNKLESSSTLSQVLGPERHVRVRTYGKGVTKTRLSVLSQMNGKFAQIHEENLQLKTQMAHLQNMMDEFKKHLDQNKAITEETPTASTVHSQNISHNTKCKLLDWMDTGDVVAEGHWVSSDRKELVHFIPIGPNAMKVWVDVAKKSEVFLWRTSSEMTYMEEAIGSCIAWPADKVIMDSSLG